MPPRGGAICDVASRRSTGELPEQPSRDWNADVAPEEPGRKGEVAFRAPEVKAGLPTGPAGAIKAACLKPAACCLWPPPP
jgi:hypothetical protein